MAGFWKFLEIAEGILTLLVLCGGFLAFVFRTWISEWTKNRFSRAVGEQLETHRHGLNRDLEAYKVSLVRALEAYKADIDIRRSIALKMADARLDALRVLAAEFGRFASMALAMLTMNAELRNRSLAEYNSM